MVTLCMMCTFRMKAASWTFQWCCSALVCCCRICSRTCCPTPLDFHSWFDPEVLGVEANASWLFMADGPLNQGCSLQAIHGCCEMRLPHWLCPTLPRAVGGRIELLLPARLSAWMFFTTLLETFGIIWRSAFFRFRLFSQPFLVYLSSPLLCSTAHTLSPPLLLLLGLVYFDLLQHSCCESTRLYLTAPEVTAASWLGISALDLPVFTCALSLSALRWSSSLNSCK